MGDILWVSKHLMFICKADVSTIFFLKYISLFLFCFVFTIVKADKIKMVDSMLSHNEAIET